MKELDDFTVERLQAFIDKPLDNGFTREEQIALARIVLAGKEIQPLRVEIQMNNADLMRRFDEMTKWRSPAEPILMPVFESNSPELPDGWIKCSERMPDNPHPRARVLACTPNQDDAMTYRALPAGLFRTVARDATHWKYIEPPTTEK